MSDFPYLDVRLWLILFPTSTLTIPTTNPIVIVVLKGQFYRVSNAVYLLPFFCSWRDPVNKEIWVMHNIILKNILYVRSCNEKSFK